MNEILEDRGQALDLAALDHEMGHPRRTIEFRSAGILAPSFEVEDVQPPPAPGRVDREVGELRSTHPWNETRTGRAQ